MLKIDILWEYIHVKIGNKINNNSFDKKKSWRMFNVISKRYNLVNDVLSLGIHHSWRKRLIKNVPQKNNLHMLDVATGTGDVVFSVLKYKHDTVERIIGCDLAEEMMLVGKRKLSKKKYSKKASFVVGDACDLPFEDNSFDAVSISFGIRNVPDYEKALSEMRRVLKPEGKLLVLEFSLPENMVF